MHTSTPVSQVTAPVIQGSDPSRRPLIDYFSATTHFEKDSEVANLRTAIKALVRDITGYGECTPLTKTGNFGDGEKFTRINGQIKWTTFTQATLNDWDEHGRCVGALNVTFTGSSGIGSLPIAQAFSLIQGLADLGLRCCRRLDLTVDVFDDWDMDLFVIKHHLEHGHWRIPRRDPATFRWMGSIKRREDGPTAATLYLGPIGATSLVVIYDKGAQQGQERAWMRFERVSKGDDAQQLFNALLGAVDAAWECGYALELLDKFVTQAVKQAADIRDVSSFPEFPQLPKNWIRSPMAITPEMLSTAYKQVAPLSIGEMRLQGGFAAQTRHAIRSTGKTIWKLAVLETAKGRDPGSVALIMGFPHHDRITDEDFMELAQQSGLTIEQLEQAEVDTITACFRLTGSDESCISSDRQLLRAEALKRLTNPL